MSISATSMHALFILRRKIASRDEKTLNSHSGTKNWIMTSVIKDVMLSRQVGFDENRLAGVLVIYVATYENFL